MRYASLEEAEFVKKAVKHFEENPEHRSFGELEEGTFLALKWGLLDDSVLLLKLDNFFSPTVYGQAIKNKDAQHQRNSSVKKKEGNYEYAPKVK